MFFFCFKFVSIHYHAQKHNNGKIKINWNKKLTTEATYIYRGRESNWWQIYHWHPKALNSYSFLWCIIFSTSQLMHQSSSQLFGVRQLSFEIITDAFQNFFLASYINVWSFPCTKGTKRFTCKFKKEPLK